jgi:hypothetical protein
MNTKLIKPFRLCSLLCVMCIGCYGQEESPRETVLHPGQAIEATNRFGTVKISYVNPVSRRYEWDGRKRTVKLIARDTRFRGMLGIYDPADSWFFSLSTRLVVEEAIRDFKNEEEIYAFLREGSAVMDWTYTNDGLVVGFGRTPSRTQINIDIWQIMIRGNKPSNLIGAHPERIKLMSR